MILRILFVLILVGVVTSPFWAKMPKMCLSQGVPIECILIKKGF